MLAILDGTVTDATQAQIPASDDGFLRGDGVFEVVRLYGGVPYALMLAVCVSLYASFKHRHWI